jgi:hypothetical protein
MPTYTPGFNPTGRDAQWPTQRPGESEESYMRRVESWYQAQARKSPQVGSNTETKWTDTGKPWAGSGILGGESARPGGGNPFTGMQSPPSATLPGQATDPLANSTVGGGGTGVPRVGGETPPGTPGAFDFRQALADLYSDPDQAGWADDLISAYESDPKWKMPSNQKAKQLMTLAKAFQRMNMGDEAVYTMVQKAMEQGYQAQRWNLGMFSRLLQPYGLSVGSGEA